LEKSKKIFRNDHGLPAFASASARQARISRMERTKRTGGNEGIAIVSAVLLSSRAMKFSELVRLLEQEGFRLVKEKGSIRYYAKAGHPHLIRVDFHGAKEVPTGTCHAILKAAGLKRK
jgi:predicted RNA binding protein YcfA (HicA-like mRNA interferase family)